ncbi:MAG: hypothetical protein WCD75_02700 [Rhodoplanes sp.]
MPKETGIEVRDALLDTPTAAQMRSPLRPEHPSEDNERAWSSALFPTKPERSRHTLDAASNDDTIAKKRQPQRHQSAQRALANLSTNGLFVTCSPKSEP